MFHDKFFTDEKLYTNFLVLKIRCYFFIHVSSTDLIDIHDDIDIGYIKGMDIKRNNDELLPNWNLDKVNKREEIMKITFKTENS